MNKKRNIFGINNFRGLDSQTKKIKVEPNRASKGSNFIIDSGTLKTRPAFVYHKAPIKKLEKDDAIIDIYNFRGIEIVITEKRIYIEGEYESSRIKTNLPESFNFKGKEPLFQEEKDVLFIFCLGEIYVFSIISPYYILYELRNKPINVFNVETNEEKYKEFNDLPVAYEPTIFIGDQRYEDVNLLSNVTKYEVFGYSSDESQETINTILLPTNYDPSDEKHGKYFADIEFYKDSFGDLGIMPLYKGIIGDYFTIPDDKTLATYGEVVNKDEPFKVSNKFYPEKDFEATESNDEKKEIKVVSEEINLGAKEFFEMRMKEDGQNVFQFILDYFRLNTYEEEVNKLIVFEVDIVANVRFKNEETEKLLRVEKVEYKKKVYVQMYKVEDVNLGFTDPEFYETHKVTTTSVAFPPYPIIPDVVPNHTINLTPIAIKKQNFSLNDFKNLTLTAIVNEARNPDFNDGDIIRMNGRYYSEKAIKQQAKYNMENYGDHQQWRTNIGFDNGSVFDATYPDYPEFLPNSDLIIDLGVVYGRRVYDEKDYFTTRDYEDISFNVVKNLREKASLPYSEKLKWGNVKFKYWRSWSDSHGYESNQLYSSVESFSYYSEHDIFEYTTQSFSSIYSVNFDKSGSVIDNLYKLSFNNEKNAFELKIKNFFYDFNNEPSIKVRIRFEHNPDYEIISKSKFGVTFGSENRLFLAGNEDTPNIDRFNVSNDLLGDNVKNQSYELSYFPSKNYRVLGGKGAINSYVTATDTQLYITKKAYPNDQKFFIRERMLDEKGLVGYKEFKTSIDKTSLNNKTFVRFYNDMVMLDKTGLFGVEISSNVLTNERLLKARSSFINDELKEKIASYDNDKIFIYENNEYMYIFIGKTIYVADSRYLAQDPNGQVDNFNYEFVKWEIPFEFKKASLINNEIILIDSKGRNVYKIEYNKNSDAVGDYIYKKINNTSFTVNEGGKRIIDTHLFIMPMSITNEILKESYFKFDKKIYDIFAQKILKDYTIKDNKIYIDNFFKFRSIEDGQTIYGRDNEDNSYEIKVKGLDESNRDYIIIDNDEIPNDLKELYIVVENQNLYPYLILQEGNVRYIAMSLDYRGSFDIINSSDYNNNNNDYYNAIIEKLNDNIVPESSFLDGSIIKSEKIKLYWESAVLDFGNQLFEKTMFNTMIYATKQHEENTLNIGYQTMRRLKRLDETITQDLSNAFDFENVNFNLFAINTFNDFGASIPTKENNFLYIKFMLYGEGNIEINGINFIYKNNRMIKSIG